MCLVLTSKQWDTRLLGLRIDASPAMDLANFLSKERAEMGTTAKSAVVPISAPAYGEEFARSIVGLASIL